MWGVLLLVHAAIFNPPLQQVRHHPSKALHPFHSSPFFRPPRRRQRHPSFTRAVCISWRLLSHPPQVAFSSAVHSTSWLTCTWPVRGIGKLNRFFCLHSIVSIKLFGFFPILNNTKFVLIDFVVNTCCNFEVVSLSPLYCSN